MIKINLIEWSEKKIRRLTYWDMAGVKLVSLLIGMIIGAYLQFHVMTYMPAMLLFIIILAILLMFRIFRK